MKLISDSYVRNCVKPALSNLTIMSESRFSWEILVSGLLLTCAAVYMAKSGDSYAHADATPTVTGIQNRYTIVEQPQDQNVVIRLSMADQAVKVQSEAVQRQLESLKSLQGTHTSEEIRVQLENLDKELQASKAVSADLAHEISARVSEATKALANLENVKLAVVTSGNDFKIVHHSTGFAASSSYENGILIKEESFEASNLRDVHLKTSGGNIKVTGGQGREVRIRVIATGRNASIERAMERYEVVMNRNGNEVLAEVRQKDSGLWRSSWNNNIAMNIIVETPADMQFNARTSGGNIEMTQLSGKQYMRTSGGNITLVDVTGSGEARTSGGNIVAESVEGTFTLSTSGGNVTMENCKGNVTANTSGGNMNLDFLAGTLSAKTSGGSVNAKVHSLEGDLDLSTSGGNINLSMPAAISADLFAKGGAVRVDPAFNATGQIKRDQVDAKLNGGGVQIVCRTSAGSVNVKSF